MLREEFDDWAVLFDPDTGHGFGLNPTGVLVWKLLDGEHTVEALIEKLHGHADNLPEDVSNHIGEFVNQLVAQGLAGFDGTRFGLLNTADRVALPPEKCSCTSPGALSAARSFHYEPPQLIGLNSEAHAAHGVGCGNGSHASGTCSTGTGCDCCWSGAAPTHSAIGTNCYTTGNCAQYSQSCFGGVTPGY